MKNWEFIKSDISDGIWITPSFANHSCSDFNAYCSFEGDLNEIRAVKDIHIDIYVVMRFSLHIFSRKLHTEIE